MPTLIRTAAQDAMYRRWSMYLLRLSKRRRESGDRKLSRLMRLAAMYYFWRTLRPSRSWAKGVARVRTWSFEQMYTESDCWEHAFPQAPLSGSSS